MNHIANSPQRAPPTLAGCNILVVDDSRTHRKLVEMSLRQAGFTRITSAVDGRNALDMVEAEVPDLVLLDLVMPTLDGFGVCEALRRRPDCADLPILVMTSLESVEHRLRALSAGATDVILKPVYQPQLVGHTISHLERRRLVHGLREYRERTAAELAIARQMQEALLPDQKAISEIRESYGIDIGAVFEPSAELGGDLWGMWAIDASRVGLFVCDVSGHGTIAAINTFRFHTLLTRSDFDRSDPGRFLSSVNDYLSGLLSPGQYVTMMYVVLDLRLDRLEFAAAGCPEPLLALPGRPLVGLDGSGLPVGIISGTQYPTRQADFPPGSTILFHSDAFTEARLRTDDNIIGEDRVRQLTSEAFASRSPETVVSSLHAEIHELSGDVLDDDLTLLCITRPDIDLGQASGQVSLGVDSQDGRVLAVAPTLSQRLMIKRAALHAGLNADLAGDLALAGRFLAANTYVAMVLDLQWSIGDQEELLRIASSVASTPRLIFAGTPSNDIVTIATSLGLDVASIVPSPLEIPPMGAAILASIARGPTIRHSSDDRPITAADLEAALANDEITFSFQPQIALTTRQIVGAEALARWISPKLGAVPTRLLSTIADSGIAYLLADATLGAATAACAEWRITVPRMRVAINLSAASLKEPALPDLIDTHLRKAGIPPAALVVEVAETEAACCLPGLVALAELGIGLALDEFGSGETGFRTIDRLRVNLLKLNRSVVRGCETDPDAERMLHLSIAVARALGLTVAAVGVENYAVEQALRTAGCDIAQGWLYGPALSSKAILELLRA